MVHSTLSEEANLLQRFSRFTLFTAACFAALLMVAAPATSNGQEAMPEIVRQAVASSRVLHEMPRDMRLNFAIGLPLRNQEELDSLIAQISDPASPEFRHYLTAEQFAAEFGPTEEDYQALIESVKQNGLVVTGTHHNRVLLDVSGAVPDIERLLHVKMMVYDHPVRGSFYAPDRDPWLDVETKTLNITGLDNFAPPHPMSLRKVPMGKAVPYVTGSGPNGYFIGKNFRAAYAPGVGLTGSGQVVGLLEFDGFFAGDETANFKEAGLPAVPTQTVLLDGFNGAPGGGNVEVILDIMMSAYMAPGLSKVMVYEGYYPDDVLNRMATDNAAQQLSSSWGFPIDATTEQIYQEFIAQGQSMMQASGDSGAYWNGVMAPSDDTALTVVGGTSLTTSGPGGAWQYESAWPESGGGISTAYAIPGWQQGLNFGPSGGSTSMRNIPDVALTADVQIFLICDNGQWGVVGGTSAAAPLWAGFVALANQQAAAYAKPKIGFLNPRLYAIGKGASYGADFHDITSGNNGYPAVAGYDLTTGWGSPAGLHLINDLAGTATSFALSSSASAGSIKQGGTGSATLTVTAKNGFSGSVSLAASGLPTGVTAAFNPAKTTTTSTVTFTVGSSVAVGTYSLTITGTSGSLTSAVNIALTVVVPSFSLSASAATLLVPPGGSGSSTLSVTGKSGFSGSVSLSASGLPSGVTVAFSPATASTATTSKVTFAVSSSVAIGTYPVTITGTSGSLSSAATITLTVAVPSFGLSASAATLNVPQGGSGSSTLSVSGKNGFSGSVSLAASGLPTGVTAAFSPAATSTTSAVKFTVGSSVPAGTYSLTITGTSGSLSSVATIGLTVVVPSFSLSASASSLTVPEGASGSSTISVSGQNGFSGSVSLAASGLPAGVTAAFSPAATGTTSTVKFTVGSSVPAGTYTVTITGTSGSLSAAATIGLTVVVPSFSLSASATSLTVPQGASGSSTISVSGQNGFSGTVSLSASGLPTGVTAAFVPATASTTSKSTVTFSVSSSVTAGTYPLTITGTSGSLSGAATIGLTVPVPSFSLSASAATLNVPQGGGGSSTISVSGKNGFSGSVSLSTSTLPSGVTAAFSSATASATSPSAVTFAAASTATAGSFPITVNGVSGSLTNTASLTLTVLASTAGTSLVSLAPGYNITGMVVDGVPFAGGGLDGGSNGTSEAYSANLMGAVQTIGGTLFYFGPPDAPDAVSGKTISLPAGQFSSLELLAAAVNGNQSAQVFKVTYTDGSASTFTQSLSDWFTPQNFSGETKAIAMQYRDSGNGQSNHGPFYVYEYVFPLTASKTVVSVTLPNNRNVVVLAATLTNATASARSNLRH